jgi:hypothetical protein
MHHACTLLEYGIGINFNFPGADSVLLLAIIGIHFNFLGADSVLASYFA